jgi:putative redox protein
MEAKVTWDRRLTFHGSADSGFIVPLGTSHNLGGDDDGSKPIELIAVGLAGCTAMDVISILQKKNQNITAFEVQIHAERAAEHPRVITHAVLEYFITGHRIQEDAVLRAIELSATRYCPAQAMFIKVFPIDLKYHIFEIEGNHQSKLVKSGEVQVIQGPR